MDTKVLTRQHNQYIADPRQEAFKSAYFDPDSATFGNAYQSALKSNYSEATAKDILHNRPKWLSEFGGTLQVLEPNHLLAKLTDIINDTGKQGASTRDRLKAIELMMKSHGMLRDRLDINQQVFNIESVLE
jgi:hypothetical protein